METEKVETQKTKKQEIKKFTELNIKPEIVSALNRQGIITPTSIQERAIPIILEGKDLIGISKTGSGKTAAFGIPILENLAQKQGIQSLIITPTRELAVQIAKVMKEFGENIKPKITSIYGGVAINPQMDSLETAEIIVGTPGRLLDHLQRGTIDLSNLKSVVLDEADKMVEMGFIEDIERILGETPKDRQIILFGATISEEVEYLKGKFMRNPVISKAEVHVEKDFLEQYYYNVEHNEKFSLLVHLLKKEKSDRIMIFCSARYMVEAVTQNLRDNGVKAEMIHGKMSQNKRLGTIERFNKDKFHILVASSVAARGLDIRNVTHIYNYDLSQDPQEYIHRVGRTARAGEKGKAITLLTDKDYNVFNQIMNRYPELNIEVLPNEKFEKVRFQRESRRGPRYGGRGTGGYGGNRPGGNRSGGHGGRGRNSGSSNSRDHSRTRKSRDLTRSGTSWPKN